MANEPDHLILRRYAVARGRGSHDEAEGLWEQLALNNFDRVKDIVRAFHFPNGQRLPLDERDDAVNEAFMRVIAMGANFRSHEAGAFYAALVRAVNNACMDWGRKELRHKRNAGRSFDEGYDDGGDGSPNDKLLKAYEDELNARREDAEQEERSREESAGLVAWAISKVQNDNYREVLELTYLQKLYADEIADRLGISLDNVYARRSRGLKELEKILNDLRS
jgi:RNA polymerase sigma factor (sigma-70 family)